MKNLTTLLISLVLAISLPDELSAQLMNGSYGITDTNGQSPHPTHDVGVDIVDNGDGTKTGKVWIRDPNQTPKPLKSYLVDEFIEYKPKEDGSGYNWENTGRPNGGTGCVYPMPLFPFVWISVVETGRFEGTVRILWPLSE